MKIDRKMVALLIVVFLALIVIVGIPDVLHGGKETEDKLAEARSYAEQDLCGLALASYKEALALEDSVDIKLEMAEVYVKGYQIGEFTSYWKVKNFITDLVSEYHEDSRVYDAALDFMRENGDYSKVVELLDLADHSGVHSEKLEEARKWALCGYKTRPLVVDEVSMSIAGTFVLQDDGKYLVYNENLSSVYSNGFDYASPFLNGVTLVKDNGRVFLLDEEGVRKSYFDDRITACTGMGADLLACQIGDAYAYYDLEGKKVFGDFQFAGRFREGVAAVQTARGWQVIDTTGKPVSDKVFQEIKMGPSYECCIDGRIIAKENGNFSIYDTSLQKSSDFSYADCDVFFSKDGYAAVKVGEKWGFADGSGKLVLPAEYDTAKSFMNGLAAVTENETCYYISDSGEKLMTGEFKEGGYFNSAGLGVVKFELFYQVLERYYTGK